MMILLFFTIFILLGFLCFFYFLGFFWALVLGFIYLVFLSLALYFADRVILARVRAREFFWYEPLKSSLGQVAFTLKMPRAKLYETKLTPHSFYAFQGFNKENYLLIGSELRSRLTEAELKALMTLAMVRLKHTAKKNHFSSAFLLGLLTLPRLGVKKEWLKIFWNFFYFPLELVMRWLFISEKNIYLCDEEAIQSLGYSGDLISALYKLKNYEEGACYSPLASFVLPYFSLCSNQHRSVLRDFLGDEQFATLRYERLTSALGRKV